MTVCAARVQHGRGCSDQPRQNACGRPVGSHKVWAAEQPYNDLELCATSRTARTVPMHAQGTELLRTLTQQHPSSAGRHWQVAAVCAAKQALGIITTQAAQLAQWDNQLCFQPL